MFRYDFVGFDRNGRKALFVEAKRRSGTTSTWAVEMRRTMLARSSPPAESMFVLVAPDKVYVWMAGASPDAEPAVIDGQRILGSYFQNAHAAPDKIDPQAFEMLVAWWLEDLVHASPDTLDPDLKRAGLDRFAGVRIERAVAA